jgi:zinc-ribbon domain
MVKFCTSCGTANTADARFCAKCGNTMQTAEVAADPLPPLTRHPEPEIEPEKQGINWLWIGAGLGTFLLFGILYFWLFVSDDVGDNDKSLAPEATINAPVAAVPTQMFTMTEANIRDKATTVGSSIIGKMPRGSALSGVVKLGEDKTTDWLELAEGKGFVAVVNLSDTEPPVLTKMLGDKIWTTDASIEIWSLPDGRSAFIDRVGAGNKLTLAGLTANDYIEIKLKKGGVGYIAGGAAIMSRMGGKPIAIAFNPASCRFGGEIDAQFEKIGGKLRAQWAALEAREYASDEMREKEMNSVEGRSTFLRLQRSYEGLTITAIGQHYESQSLYFADSPAKVIEVFRAKGFRIGRDGTFPATEIYAGISGTRGEGAAFGKSELGCGV